jgi:hypothetical protein
MRTCVFYCKEKESGAMIIAKQKKTSKKSADKYWKFYIFHSLIYILEGSGKNTLIPLSIEMME